MRLIDLRTRRYGKLIVLRRSIRNGPHGEVVWVCKCDCGGMVRAVGDRLKNRGTKSCGCLKNRKGKDSPLWKVGLRAGYVRINDNGFRDSEHRMIIEGVLGKPIPLNAVPHHIDENRENNTKTNLISCEDRAYHNLIHARMRAKKECGDANWMRCCYCKTHDAPANMYIRPDRRTARHYDCQNKYMEEYREGKKCN